MEVYVDDVLVKSPRLVDHIVDLQEAFDVLRRGNMKLNNVKYGFKVTSRKFRGFMITSRVIEINQEKITAITNMKERKTIHELQSLNRTA